MNKKPDCFKYKWVSLSLALLPMPFLCTAAASPFVYPFDSIPAHLTGGKAKVPPNVLLFIDTSGSMGASISDGGVISTRADVAKKVSKEVIANNRNVRWGLSTFRQGMLGLGADIVIPVMAISNDTPTNQNNFNALNNGIDGLRFYGPTPTTSAYYELTRYYRGMSSSLPVAGKQYLSPIEYRCQKNFIIYISDGLPNIPNRWSNSIWSAAQTHRTQLNWYNESRRWASLQPLGAAYNEAGPFGGVSTGQAFIDSPSAGYDDGDKVYNCSANNTCTMYNELGLSYFARIANEQDMVTNSTNLNNGLQVGKDKEGKSFDGSDDADPEEFKKQTIQTYTVGFGLDVPTLKFAANAGGGEYFTAFDAQQLSIALNDIINSIGIAAAPFSGTTPNASTPQSGGKIDSAVATTLKAANWSSQLRFFKVLDNGFLNTDLSTAQRATYVPANAVAIIVVPNTTNADRVSLLSDSASLSNADFAISSADGNQWKKLVNWLTRRAAADADTGYRVRSTDDIYDRYLGDVLDGTVEMAGLKDKGNYQYGDSQKEYIAIGSNDGMLHVYRKFGAENHQYKDIFQFIPGAAKRELNNETLIKQLKYTADAKYGKQGADTAHKFLVNAPTSWFETDGNNTQVALTGGLGQGGRAVYALNLDGTGYVGSGTQKAAVGLGAAATSWLNTVPLWDTSTNAFGDSNLRTQVEPSLGYITGVPVNGRLNLDGRAAVAAGSGSGRYVLDMRYTTLFGNGFNAPPVNAQTCRININNCIYAKPSLFVIDSLGINAGAVGVSSVSGETMTTNYTVENNRKSDSAAGRLLAKIEVSASNLATNTPRGLTTPVGVYLEKDGFIDLAYAGDQNGNIYRFDFRGKKDKWNAELIFQGDEKHPITVSPTAYYNPKNNKVTVIFGTGSVLYPDDLTDKTVQTLYGIQDEISLDNPEVQGDLGIGYPRTIGDKGIRLIKRTFRVDSADGQRYLINGNEKMQATHVGWYMDLQNGVTSPTGERLLAAPTLGGNPRYGASVQFNTTILSPPDSGDKVIEGCTAPTTSTSGYRMLLDAESGSKPISFRFSKDSNDLIGIPFVGKSSSLGLITGNPYAMDAYGLSRNGKIPPLGLKPDIKQCENGKLVGVVGSTETGGQVYEYYCESGGAGVKRLSWREIF